MIREGSGPAIVLLHGVLNSENVWRRVISFLSRKNEVIAATAVGHRGGRKATSKIGIPELVDDVERTLDELELDKAHLAGNSLGGWIALELAKRGRALTVCALSPAGFWDVANRGHEYSLVKLRKRVDSVGRTRWLLPLLSHSAYFRRFAMRDAARFGNRLTAQQFVRGADDILGCEVRQELLSQRAVDMPEARDLDSLPCPILLAWSEFDRLFPVSTNGERARKLIPQASWRVLPDVGHIPMVDDPKLVADTILASVAQAD